MAETMILRFRDLSDLNPGETIERHQAKIRESTFVWWGWWSKAGETIPGGTFQALMAAIDRDGHLNAFLFDTGTRTLYPARITEIRWDARFREMESPQPEATPAYYAGRKLKAWFRLSQIDEGSRDQTILRRWSYVDVVEFFETKRSIFQDFDRKQVSSFEELEHQNRTIWFVRAFQAGDEIREILLYDTGRIKPSNFPENVIECGSPRLLWLSDLHFSQDHHAFPLVDREQAGNRLAEAIRQDLEALDYHDVGGILITGDLTWKGAAEEFALVRAFLADIMSWSALSPNQILLCPGNHDIAFSKQPWEKGKLIPEAPATSKQEFERFYSELFSVVPNEYLAAGRRFLLGRSVVVELAGLNSSHLRQTEKIFQGHGYIGEGQRKLVAEEMGWREHDAGPRPFRVVLLHHHVVPVIPAELAVYEEQSSIVYDAGALCNWLVKHQVDLVLHGHMHHTKVVREARSLGLSEGHTQWQEFVIAALGSTGVGLSHNQLDRRNVYGLLEFSGADVRLRVREIHPRDVDRPTHPTIVDVRIPRGK